MLLLVVMFIMLILTQGLLGDEIDDGGFGILLIKRGPKY